MLLILIRKWRDILIDFIVDLLNGNKFVNVMVVVDCLIKMQYMIFMDSINAISVAECFVKYVFKLYRFPNLIISDYGS